jgi:surfeit locus 1 family protein
MELKFGQRIFAPRLWSLLLTLAAMAGFSWLGVWQLDRGREKQALITAFERGSEAPVALDGRALDALPRYQRVEASGQYQVDRQILLDNMPGANGSAGFRVLTPLLRPGASRLLLVDRGWVPLGLSRERLPAVPVDTRWRSVTGKLDGLPVPGIRVGTAGTPGDASWPRVLNFPRQTDVEQVLGVPVEPRILLLDAAQPDGYERVWRPAMGFPPARHIGYALQWFAAAITALVLFISLNLRRSQTGEGIDSHG